MRKRRVIRVYVGRERGLTPKEKLNVNGMEMFGEKRERRRVSREST